MDLVWLKIKQAPQLLHEHVCVCTHTCAFGIAVEVLP